MSGEFMAKFIGDCLKEGQTTPEEICASATGRVKIVDERMNRSLTELERKLHASLQGGSFVSQGAHQAVSESGKDVLEAAKSFLATTATKVFDRYADAAHRVKIMTVCVALWSLMTMLCGLATEITIGSVTISASISWIIARL